MSKNTEHKPKNPTLREILPQLHLSTMAEEFLYAKKIEGVSEGTLENYYRVTQKFIKFCDTLLIKDITQVDVATIRKYMMWLEKQGHNPGGCHFHYRAIRTFLFWCEREEEIENWKNPFATKRLKAPKLDEQPLEPIPDDVIKKMIDACDNTIKGIRDKAILLILTDTGVRASELYNMQVSDVNWIQRSILIQRGKGGKPRFVFFSKQSKKTLIAYLRMRDDDCLNLFATIPFRGRQAEPMNYSALRDIMRDVSKKANVETPKIHGFRRTFAITMLRNGCDIFTLQRLMGHADLQVLRRYLKHNTNDLKEAHDKGSPVEKILKKGRY